MFLLQFFWEQNDFFENRFDSKIISKIVLVKIFL